MKKTLSAFILLAVVAATLASCKPHQKSCAAYENIKIEKSE
ncbi:MAG: hypothetical protein SH856_08560 [Flavobacteriales bacterium]|nr:hypothetical protein [Flavobacteriales bacterium]